MPGGEAEAQRECRVRLSARPRLVIWMWGALLLPSASAAQALLAPLIDSQGQLAPVWQVAGIPKQVMALTRFEAALVEGQRVLRVDAQDSYGNLVHRLGDTAARTLSWRWRVDQPNLAANPRHRAGDDAAVKVCAMFDLPLSAVPFGERLMLRWARFLTGEELPAANLCYLWDNQLAPDTAMPNVYSKRLRFIVLRGSGSIAGQWSNERRDLHTDFLRLFGDEVRQVPPLRAIAVTGDADNTHGHSLAYVADLVLE